MDSFLAAVLLIDDLGSLSYFPFFLRNCTTERYVTVAITIGSKSYRSSSNNFVSCILSDFNKIIFVNMHLPLCLILIEFLFLLSPLIYLKAHHTHAESFNNCKISSLVLSYFLFLFYFKNHIVEITDWDYFELRRTFVDLHYDRNENIANSRKISVILFILLNYFLKMLYFAIFLRTLFVILYNIFYINNDFSSPILSLIIRFNDFY